MCVFLLSIVICVGSIMYLFESPSCLEIPTSDILMPHSCQPWSQFDSIPVACWWALSTLTAIGYGDYVPVGHAGKGFSALTSMFAVMTLCFTSAFMAEWIKDFWVREKAKLIARRHCGDDPILNQELDMVENLLTKFQGSLEDVVSRLEDSIQDLEDDGRGLVALAAFTMLKNHSTQIMSELNSYVRELTFTTALKKSRNEIEGIARR